MTPLEKMNFFELEIAKAKLPSNLMEQQTNFERIYSQLVEYLNVEVKNASEESRTIQMIIGELEFIKRKYMNNEFVKDQKKRIEKISEKLSETETGLKTQIRVLKDYILDGNIIKSAD